MMERGALRSHNGRLLGGILLVLPPVLVGFLYLVLHEINAVEAARADAPDQGSMMTLFLVLVAGVIIGMIAMAFGLVMILQSPKK